ncbi:MAG: M3 family oligoendopeptidase [Nanoarchaeota archaeon]
MQLPEKPGTWNLSSLSGPSQESIKRIARELEHSRKELNNLSIPRFLKLLHTFEDLKSQSARLISYWHLRFSENSSDQEASAHLSKAQMFLAKIDNQLLFFSFWWKDLPEKDTKKYLNASGPYQYYLEQIRKTKPYTLSEKEEHVINILNTSGISALNTAYHVLTSQLSFPFKGKKISQNELMVNFRDKSPQTRKEAYISLLTTYSQYKDVIGEVYRAIVNTWREENVTIRKYASPINVRNIYNDLPDGIVDTLLSVCQKNEKEFHRFFAIKKQKLGLKKMTRFDIYAPIEEEKKNIPYKKAVSQVLSVFNQFSPEFGKHAEELFKQKHVHATLQKNKNPGAFCSGITKDLAPYVLLNYTGTLRDVETLAHELGHAVHFSLAKHQTEFTQEACLPLAETASIFGEMILTEQLKKDYPDQAFNLTFTKVDEFYASIIRQIGFTVFERIAHDLIAQGKTMDDISDAYLALLKVQLGPDIIIDDRYRYEWLYIPHIYHTPFYCYAYAFGNLLVLSLYARYQKEGAPFAKKIIELLKKGGSASPVDITKAVGIDITQESFWQEGFDIIKNMIDSLECK